VAWSVCNAVILNHDERINAKTTSNILFVCKNNVEQTLPNIHTYNDVIVDLIRSCMINTNLLNLNGNMLSHNLYNPLNEQENEIEAIEILLEEGELVSIKNISPLKKGIECIAVRDKFNMEDDGMFMEDECPQQISQGFQRSDSKTPSTSHYSSDTFSYAEDM